MHFTRRVVLASFRASVPVLLGYLAMGFAAGILLAKQSGAGALWAFATSVSSVSGALQFLLVDWFTHPTSLLTIALVTLSINLRYALYGLPLIERWKHLPWLLKAYMILTLTDETFALEVENKFPSGEDSLTYCFTIAALDHLYWVVGVVAGALAGHAVEFNAKGIDFAMTALFMVILLDQLQTRANRAPALVGLGGSLCGLAIFPQNMLIPSVIIILALLLSLRDRLEEELPHA